jgi:YbgC/YbaW family acyl-CoA thioester hydrolase
MYFDTAVAGYWRALAMPYAQTMEMLEGDLFVRKASVEYFDSARYDDLLDIGMRCARVGTSSMLFNGAAYRGDRLLVSCELVYVFADPQAQTSRPVPASLRSVIEAFEGGQAMVETRLGTWQELGDAARTIRGAVFVDEQRIPLELEWDDADAQAVHVVAFNRFGAALATGRLLVEAPGVARIGRMAVSQTVRGSGVGRAMLEALTGAARARGDREIVLHAQVTAQPFYARAGYVVSGPVFDEAGIAHVEMKKRL